MQRVLIGISGAGMSTLARELAARMRLSQIHLDSEFWKPGWKVTERAEWRAKVTKLAERVAWIMDGNYGASLDLRLPRDDTLMWFDYPRLLCAWGALWRVATIYGRVRPDLAPGPGARTWRPGAPRNSIANSCASSGKNRPQIVAMLVEHGEHLSPIVFHRHLDATGFLAGLGAN